MLEEPTTDPLPNFRRWNTIICLFQWNAFCIKCWWIKLREYFHWKIHNGFTKAGLCQRAALNRVQSFVFWILPRLRPARHDCSGCVALLLIFAHNPQSSPHTLHNFIDFFLNRAKITGPRSSTTMQPTVYEFKEKYNSVPFSVSVIQSQKQNSGFAATTHFLQRFNNGWWWCWSGSYLCHLRLGLSQVWGLS